MESTKNMAEALSQLQNNVKDTGSTAVQIVYTFFRMQHLIQQN